MNSVAASLAKTWSFYPTEELFGGHCSHVYANESQVLKVPFQGEEMASGYWAMVGFHGPFAPKIVASDPSTGSILMERANPGTKLHESALSEQEQLQVWRSIDTDWHNIDREKLMSLEDYVDREDQLANYLLDSTTEVASLHGDLHHENILRHGAGWMCIDAKGLIGDPAFEGAAYVRNPLPGIGDFDTKQIEERVLQVATAMQVDPFRVWGWSVTQLREGNPPTGPWANVVARLCECAGAFGAEDWV
jgi:streptomycin 6-kinase